MGGILASLILTLANPLAISPLQERPTPYTLEDFPLICSTAEGRGPAEFTIEATVRESDFGPIIRGVKNFQPSDSEREARQTLGMRITPTHFYAWRNRLGGAGSMVTKISREDLTFVRTYQRSAADERQTLSSGACRTASTPAPTE